LTTLEIIHKGYLNKSWTFVQQRCYIRYNHVTGGNPQLPQMCFYNLVEDLSILDTSSHHCPPLYILYIGYYID